MNRAFCVISGQHIVPVTATSPKQAVREALLRLVKREDGILESTLGPSVEVHDEFPGADGALYLTTKEATRLAGLVLVEEAAKAKSGAVNRIAGFAGRKKVTV